MSLVERWVYPDRRPMDIGGGGFRGEVGSQACQVEGLVLAAGKSVRMGGSCKLAPAAGWGSPLLVRTLKSLMPLCRRITIVTGAHVRTIENLVTAFAPTASEKGTQLDCVHHSGYERGMFSSLQAGIRHVLERTAAYKAEATAISPVLLFAMRTPLRILVLPGDCPFVDSFVCERLLRMCTEAGAEGGRARLRRKTGTSCFVWKPCGPDDYEHAGNGLSAGYSLGLGTPFCPCRLPRHPSGCGYAGGLAGHHSPDEGRSIQLDDIGKPVRTHGFRRQSGKVVARGTVRTFGRKACCSRKRSVRIAPRAEILSIEIPPLPDAADAA